MTVEFSLVNLRVVGVEGGLESTEDEDFQWLVSFEPQPGDDGGHVVIGTLQSSVDGGRLALTTGATFVPREEIAEADLGAAIMSSGALEIVYNYARTVTNSVLGLLEVDGRPPYTSPTAQIEALVESTEQASAAASKEPLD